MYFRQRLLSLVNMGLHAVIIRLSPLILEGKQRCKPYIVGDPRMVSMSVTPPFEKSWLRPWCVHTSRIESLLNLTPLYTFVSKNVASVSDISAVNLMSVGNLVPRALFPGFGGGAGKGFSRPAPKTREKRPGDEVGV